MPALLWISTPRDPGSESTAFRYAARPEGDSSCHCLASLQRQIIRRNTGIALGGGRGRGRRALALYTRHDNVGVLLEWDLHHTNRNFGYEGSVCMKHWLKCLLLAISIFILPSSTPSLAISASHPPTRTGLWARSPRELVAPAAAGLRRLINRPPSLSRMEQLLLFSFSSSLVVLQLRRKHEILSAPRLPM